MWSFTVKPWTIWSHSSNESLSTFWSYFFSFYWIVTRVQVTKEQDAVSNRVHSSVCAIFRHYLKVYPRISRVSLSKSCIGVWETPVTVVRKWRSYQGKEWRQGNARTDFYGLQNQDQHHTFFQNYFIPYVGYTPLITRCFPQNSLPHYPSQFGFSLHVHLGEWMRVPGVQRKRDGSSLYSWWV